jgi:FAD/FMN-containing dehydrogenase
VVGNFQQRWGLDEGLSYDLGCTAHPPAQRDFYEVGRLHPEERFWNKNWPCLDIVLPLPDGVATFHEIHRQIRRGLLKRYLRLGSTLRVVKAPPSDLKRLPLAPVVGSGYDLLLSIRPVVSGYAAHSVLPELLALRELALDRGGKIYLMSVEPRDPSQLQLERQFGTALDTFETLKERFDPNGLLNPGLLA